MVEGRVQAAKNQEVVVSIRRADYWLVEGASFNPIYARWMVSIRRADYWLVEAKMGFKADAAKIVSIRRADYWLVEVTHIG